MICSRDSLTAVTQLQEAGCIHLSPLTEILDLGCGSCLGWVPELLESHRFSRYVGVDQLSVNEMRFRPEHVKDQSAESLVYSSQMVLVDWFNYYDENRAESTSLTVDDFTQRIELIGDVDLRDQSWPGVLSSRKFGLVIVSDVLHLMKTEHSMVFLEQVKGLASNGAEVVIRYFKSHPTYGMVEDAVVSRMIELFGEPVVIAVAGAGPTHVTKLFRIA